MKEILQKYIIILRKDRTRRKKLLGVLCTLSVIVMLAVAWQLRFVGIAQTDVPSCGMEEHEHTAECIERRLICELKEGEPEPDSETETQAPVVHHHSAECYEEFRTLHCDQAEHVHTDDCYEIVKTMNCLKEEHTHGTSCYEIQKELICTEDHEHTDACYEEKQVLICPKEEHTHNDEECYKVEKILKCQQPEHSHSDECYTVENKLICGKDEGQVEETFTVDEETGEKIGGPKLHVHTDECYQDVYVCGKTAHKHTLDCYSDPKADVETYEDWEKTLPKKAGRTWNESMLQVAQSQMDYKESTKNFKAADDGQRKQGYTRYGEWYGNAYGDWNTMFVSFCLRYSGIAEEAVPRHSGAFAMTVKLKDMDLLEGPEYEPKPGDVVFFQDDPEGNINRSAIVAALGNMIVDDVKVPCITIIEGDRNDAVSPYKYALDDTVVAGYISMEKAYNRAVEMKIPPEALPDADEAPETAGTTEPTETPTIDFTPEEQDDELAKMLYKFNAKAVSYTAALKAEDDAAAKVARVGMEQIYKEMEARHAKLNPDAAEDDFVIYMEDNANSYYNVYLEALKKYPEVEQTIPGETTEGTVPGETTEGTVPGETTEGTVPDETTEGTVPGETTEGTVPGETTEGTVPGETTEGTVPDETTEGTVPGETTEGTVPDETIEGTIPQENESLTPKQEPLSAETVKLLDAMATKATEYQYALQAEDKKKIRSLSEDMNLLYDQAKILYYNQYPEAAETDFDTYLNKEFAKSVEMMADAEKRVGTRSLDALLKSKLETFSQKAEVCAKAMNIGETKQAKELKLDMDQLYIEMQDLHAKRYPDAPEGNFDIYLNNNAAKAVKRYLSAVEAFTEIKLENYVTYTDPVSGEARRIFKLEDGMEVDVQVTGSICFPIQQQAEKPLDARETTANLDTVASDGAILNSTQAAAQGTTTASTTVAAETTETAGTTVGTTTSNETTAGTTAPNETTEGTTAPNETTEGTTAPNETTEGTTAPNETTEGTTAPNETTEGTTAPDETTEGTTASSEPAEGAANNQPKAPAEDNRWDRINLDVVPVSEDAELAFAQYIGEHYPDATGMTMMDLKYQYNGMDLDVGDANVNVVLSPSEKAPEAPPAAAPMMMMLMDEPQMPAPMILNAPVVKSMSPAMAAAEEREQKNQEKGTENAKEEPVVMTVLERKADGSIEPVAQETLDRRNGNIPDLRLRAARGSTYATLNTPVDTVVTNPRPIDNHKQWPEAWGGIMDGIQKDADGNAVQIDGVNQRFILRNDPYFIQQYTNKVPDFEKPETKIGYILRNYNAFVFEPTDAVVAHHIIGSVAIAGDAYYDIAQGGNAGGQKNPKNTAPTYIGGTLRRFDKNKWDPTKDEIPSDQSLDRKKLEINLEQPDPKMPTYLGPSNHPDNEPVSKTDFSQVYNWTLKGEDKDRVTPYYFVEDYFDFTDFKNGIDAQTNYAPGITIDPYNTTAKMDKDGYQWGKKDDANYLYIRIGHAYEVKHSSTLQNARICLVPPLGYDFGDVAENDKDPYINHYNARSLILMSMQKNTTIRCTDTAPVDLYIGKENNGTYTYSSSVMYCYKDVRSYDGNDVEDVALADIPGYYDHFKSSFILLFPNTTDVRCCTMEGHIVAPKATIKFYGGDYYGGVICNRIRSMADLHVLKYGQPGEDFEFDPLAFEMNKKIVDEKGAAPRDPDGSDKETFHFTIKPYGFYKMNADMTYSDKKSTWPALVNQDSIASFDVTNNGSEIDVTSVKTAVEAYFVNMTKALKANNDYYGHYGDYKGMYVFSVTEATPSNKDFKKDETTYYMAFSYRQPDGFTGNDNLNSYIPGLIGEVSYYSTKKAPYQKEVVITFVNEKQVGYTGPELPKSGGAGTHIFTITGFALMMIPVFLVSARKKRGA